MGDLYTVTVDGPDNTQVKRILSGELVRAAIAGPLQPHAKAAFLASIDIEEAFERGELGVS